MFYVCIEYEEYVLDSRLSCLEWHNLKLANRCTQNYAILMQVKSFQLFSPFFLQTIVNFLLKKDAVLLKYLSASACPVALTETAVLLLMPLSDLICICTFTYI